MAERKKWNPHLEANEKTERIRNKIGSQTIAVVWVVWRILDNQLRTL